MKDEIGGHVVRMREKKNARKILVGIPEGQWPLERPRHSWEVIQGIFLYYCYDGVRLCPCGTAATNGPIVLPTDEQGRDDNDREKPKDSEKNLSQSHVVHRKSHIDRSGSVRGPAQEEAGD
jgi:hypothetical protein